MNRRVNSTIVLALVKRDLRRYFTNPTGYVFITLFIFLSAAAAFWTPRFFLNNLANLDQLNDLFAYLLVLFVPALTMAVWSDERRQGTDELLLTLPATDLELVLGKYLACLGIYTASLVLSLSHVFVLFWLGSPDLGLMFGNYTGYWLAGAGLIAVGMLASLLTANVTIAFVMGALGCASLVFADRVVGLFSDTLGELARSLSIVPHFAEFARGVVSLSALFYFLSLTALALYVNVLLIERRHWPRTAAGWPMWTHHAIRVAALAVALASVNVVVARSGMRVDATAERLHTLSRETHALLDELDTERPVFIQAFVSPAVPEQYVQPRVNLLGLLREINATAGSRVQVLVTETEPFTDAARDARERFGIVPRQVADLSSASSGSADVFLGVAFTCGAEEQVIPFFDRGLPAEYELLRSIRVVARTERRTIGIVRSAIDLFGGFDFQSMRSNPAWSVVEELKKQYDVVPIDPAQPIVEAVDGLLVVLPSSLPQEPMANVQAAIRSGIPALVLVDPLLLVNPSLSPSERAGAERNPFQSQGQPPPQPKGNVQQMIAELGVRWTPGAVVWDDYNPHPDLAHLPPEIVFVGRGSDNAEAFNAVNAISRDMQELVLLYPGHLEEADPARFVFEPLLRSGSASGRLQYQQMVQRSFFGVQMRRDLPHRADEADYVVAAQVTSTGVSGDTDDTDGGDVINVIVVADVDFIGEQFFQIREIGPPNLNFDNVSFFLNAMDTLVGDESFVALRSRRVRHRTLERVEAQTRQFTERRSDEEAQAEAEADAALADAQRRLDERVAEVQSRTDLDARTKQIMARNLQEVENRRFKVLEANIKTEKEAKIASSKETMEAQTRRIQSSIRTSAVLLPPVPVFVLGVLIFVRRQRREREGAAAARRLRTDG